MIRTRRLRLRRFRNDDLDPFAAVLADVATMKASGGAYAYERARAELGHYLEHFERHGFAPCAVVQDGVLIGDVGLQQLEDGPAVELLYRISSNAWGRGLATEACDAILEHGFAALDVPEIVAVIAEDNVPSRRLAAKLGFIAGDVSTYYGQRLVRHWITPELHTRSVLRRETPRLG